MNEITYPDYASLGELLTKHDILATPAEVHGLLSGLLAGGLPVDDSSWQVHLNELFNDGLALPRALLREIEELIQTTEKLYKGANFEFYPLLPGDSEPLDERAESMAQWVQNFLVGFALICQELSKAPEDIQEAIEDFNYISRLSLELDDGDDENEQAYFEIYEYVRMGCMACFNYYVLRTANERSKTLH